MEGGASRDGDPRTRSHANTPPQLTTNVAVVMLHLVCVLVVSLLIFSVRLVASCSDDYGQKKGGNVVR